ncbi:MAG: type II toxin-antitoxin system Phd/YefM family antitoxin, partial [Candidatus Binatia bacterium]
MNKVDIRQAKTQLSRLVERAVAGEEVVITKSGKPVARLISYV